MVRGSGGEVRETSDICGTISDQWAEDEVKGGCEVREQSGGAKSVRPLARQGACGPDPSIRTLSKDAPGDRGRVNGPLEDLSFQGCQWDWYQKGVGRNGGRVAIERQRGEAPHPDSP